MERHGRCDACGFKNRGADIDRHHEIITDLSRFYLSWPTHDHGNACAFVVEKLFASNVTATMIADEEDDGVLGETLVLEALQKCAHFAIDELHLFQAVGPIAANEGCVRIVRGKFHILDVDGALRISIPRSMRAAKRDAGEEGLVRLALAPILAHEQLLSRIRQEIAIRLPTHDTREVASIGEEMRNGTNAVRQRLLVGRPMLVSTDIVLVEAGHHGRTRGRADGRGREGSFVADAFRCQLIHMWRVDALRAIARQVGAPILDGDPKYVGLGREGLRDEHGGEEEGEY